MKYQAYDQYVEHLLDTDDLDEATEAARKGEGFVIEGKIVYTDWTKYED